MPTVLVEGLTSNEIDQSFEVNQGQILFFELERQGLKLPHGCLSGSCGACRIIITEGSTNLAPPGTVESDTVASLKESYIVSGRSSEIENKDVRLSCRARVLGNVKMKVLT